MIFLHHIKTIKPFSVGRIVIVVNKQQSEIRAKSFGNPRCAIDRERQRLKKSRLKAIPSV